MYRQNVNLNSFPETKFRGSLNCSSTIAALIMFAIGSLLKTMSEGQFMGREDVLSSKLKVSNLQYYFTTSICG